MKTKLLLLSVITSIAFSLSAQEYEYVPLVLERPGEILIVGGVVESGGTLITNSSVGVVGNFEIKEGANVELN